MINYKYVISDEQRLHTTNAMGLRRAISDYGNDIILRGERKSVDCKNVLVLMSLGVRQGECLEPLVERSDEDQATGFLQGLMRTIL